MVAEATSTSSIKKPFAGDVFLGLENGALVESVYFYQVWKHLHPDEAEVVLIAPAEDLSVKRRPITAVTLYSINGVVRAHTSDYGKVPIDSLQPSDLRNSPAICLQEYLKTVARLPKSQVAIYGSREEQLQRAFDLLHNNKKVQFMPVALSKVPGFDGRCLIFDWNEEHYAWQPGTGAIRLDTPKDPVTGRSLLCVKHGDLVEALIFVRDYQRLHPNEKAGLLLASYDGNGGADSVGLAAAAYTIKSVVHVRGYYFGDLVLDKNTHSFQPGDLVVLSRMYKELLVKTLGRYYEQTHSYALAPASYWENVYNSLPSAFPQNLPGDTDEMQQCRVYQRAIEEGIPGEIAANPERGRLVLLRWGAERLSYGDTWNYYGGDWLATDLAEFNYPESFLGLENGSLLESIHFRAVWLKVHPSEDAIVLVTSPGPGKDGRYPPVTAVTEYTNNGKVLVHDQEYGTVHLDGLLPDDLKRGAARSLAQYRRTTARLPKQKNMPSAASADQIQRAFQALQDPKTMPYFPVAIAEIPSVSKTVDGKTVRHNRKMLFFDWNDSRYDWCPEVGALRSDPPKDKLTGRPHLCVQHGDLVESLIFVHDFQRTHPREKAILLYAPSAVDCGVSTFGLAAAAYTLDGAVHIRGYFTDDFLPDAPDCPFKPKDLNDPDAVARLYQRYKDDILTIAARYYNKEHPKEPQSTVVRQEIYEIHQPAYPQSMFGDTPEMQENRVFQRALEAGIPCVITEQKGLGRLVVLHWRAQRFCYTCNWQNTGKALCYYDGIWDPNDSERFIDAILFARHFNSENPGDGVVVLPYRELGVWDIAKGVAVYTKGGKVYAHNPEVGDTPIPNAQPGDLADPSKLRSLRLAANNAIHAIDGLKTAENNAELVKKFQAELKAKIQARGLDGDKAAVRRLVYAMLMSPCKIDCVEVPSVYAKLRASGVPCELQESTYERRPDGTVFNEALPSVCFTFQGARYTYGPEHYCSEADRLVLDP